MIDHATTVGGDPELLVADVDGDGHVVHRHAGEAAPSSDLLVLVAAVGGGPGEQHSAEHTHPAGCAVAGIRDDRGNVPPAPGALLPELMNAVFPARGEVHYRLGRRGHDGVFAEPSHAHSLPCPGGRSPMIALSRECE